MIRPVDLSVLRLGRIPQSKLPPIGQKVQAEVLRLLGGNRVLLRLAGESVLARARVSLSPGQRLSVTVDRSGATTLLRIDPPGIEQTLFRQAQVPSDPATSALFRAMVRAGLPLDPEILRRLRNALGSLRQPAEETARFLVEAYRKGMILSDTAVEAVDEYTGGSEGDAKGGRRRRQSRRNDPESEEEGGVDPMESEKSVAAIRRLFNHLSSEDDHWVVLPLRFDDRTEWKGSARIRFGKDGSWREAAIAFDTGAVRHWALVSSENRSVTFYPDSALKETGARAREASGRLRSALETLGFPNLRFGDVPDDFDGFSTVYSPDIIRPIDEEA